MFTFPSTVVVVLQLTYIALWLLDRLALNGRAQSASIIARFAIGAALLILCSIRFFLLGTFMAGWAAVGSICYVALAGYHWTQRPVVRPEAATVPPPAPVTSPAVRLQEIRSEMSKLETEKNELENRPDANRF